MKWFIVTTLLVATILQISAAKNNEKTLRPIKKANSVKPTKYPKSLLDEFSGLTDEDTKFIKELDKQFKVHGEKIKIKVEKENATTTKNSKRTIDGSLGYGYHQPQQQLQQGFYFSQPKFMVYPYSQQDILPPRYQQNQPQGGFVPNHGPGGNVRFANQQSNLHTSIRDDEPQRPNRFGDYRGPQLFPQQQIQNQQVPVIVLRIPGPAKYASHLQALLQQYLEIRASQYINELQQQEQQNLQIATTPQPQQFSGPRYLPNGQPQGPPQQQQRIIPVHQTPVGYVTPGPIGQFRQQPQAYSTTAASYTDDNVGVYPSQTVYEEHKVVSPQPIENQQQSQHHQFHQIQQLQNFQQIQNIQHQQRQQYIQQIQQQQQLQIQQQHLQAQQQQQHQHSEEEEREVVLSPHQQEALRQQQQAAYEQSFPRDQPEVEEEEEEEQEQPQQQFTYQRQPHPAELQEEPPINENYPSVHHTRVILPQQRAPEQYLREVFHPQQQQQQSTPGPYNYQAPEEDQQLQYNTPVEITPKPIRIPFNYHARSIPAIPERRRDVPYSQDQFSKYTNVINRLKKKTIQPIVVQDE